MYWTKTQILTLLLSHANAPACVSLTHEAVSAMLKRLRGGSSVYSELALYHPPNPSPTPFAHRHTVWVCEFKCVLRACLSALSLYVHAHREGFFSLVCISAFLLPPALYTHQSDLTCWLPPLYTKCRREPRLIMMFQGWIFFYSLAFYWLFSRWPLTVVGCVLLLRHRTLPHLCPLTWLSTFYSED